ncbi:hypothetical protein ND861_07940 [Leptospira sp. 2 VSF19]|uniref:Uncharacterized protein n=1 Tax=Leptospira soteropolitanensis TaxID=2950025 RepID=A0AAW5VL61_9LEPT|nr:hypothetical protein [Leptospira soteropolitanensis]MCW7492924.1 hypothetical protein [Leptospira soteropolitanensis]MCW7500159.1 hypothetical protein [Leptospira soteropolitanensis]MCW7522410.1 hypothetical protein [Leptospira soteropolitanensis]MCW7526266.1 hypothetical protein [Leptospira soteropolitanensis]MCW7529622.1 hypothetical protein [Leptospira soteropolitanensis]
MGRRDNLKILTTAILVVLLLSSFIFAFIYRNEIYQKLQTIGKNRDVEVADREIQGENPGIPAPKENFTRNENKESVEDRSKLPELPSLDDMEPESNHPRSVSVAASTKTKEKVDPSSRLQDKLDQVEESISPKEDLKKTKKTPLKEEVVSEGMETSSSTKQPKLETKDSMKLNHKADSKVVKSSKAEPKSSRTKKYNSVSDKKQSTKSKKTYYSQKTSKVNSGDTNTSSLEVRMRNVEQKLSTQNDRNEKRFVEIERRIESLEKALAK